MVSFFISFLTLWHLTTATWGNIVTAWCHRKGNHSWVTRSPKSSHHRKEQKWAFQCLSCTSKTVDKGRRSGCKWWNNSVYLYTFFLLCCDTIPTNCHVRPRPAVWRSSQFYDIPHPQPLDRGRTTLAWWTGIDRARDEVPACIRLGEGG